jgi:two-component system cell cycle response regulator CtrA
MTKPFHRDELVARINSIVRCSKGEHQQSIIKIGRLSINLDTKMVRMNDAPLHLTNKEYHILELLSFRKGSPIRKETVHKHLYRGMDELVIKIIDVFI